jgi:hypothetical protein
MLSEIVAQKVLVLEHLKYCFNIFIFMDHYILGIRTTPVMEFSNKNFESQTCLHNEGEKFAYLTTGFHI